MSFLSPVVPVWGDVQFSSGWIQSCCSPRPWLGRCTGEGKTATEISRPDYNVTRDQGERNALAQSGCFQLISMGPELLWDWQQIRKFFESIQELWKVQKGSTLCKYQVRNGRSQPIAIRCRSVMNVSKSENFTGVSVEFSVYIILFTCCTCYMQFWCFVN